MPLPDKPTIPLPKEFAGKLLAPGECLDCGQFATLYQLTGYMGRDNLKQPVPILVHQGKACGGFRKRFAAPDEGAPAVTAACDEQGTFVGDVPDGVGIDVAPATKVLPPGSAGGHPLRRRNSDNGGNGGGDGG